MTQPNTTGRERIAIVCGNFNHEKPEKRCNWRAFGDPKAVCPQHLTGKRQPNRAHVRPTV